MELRGDCPGGLFGDLLGDAEEENRESDDGSNWKVDVETCRSVSDTAIRERKGNLLHLHV